jgi:hypothetical protein
MPLPVTCVGERRGGRGEGETLGGRVEEGGRTPGVGQRECASTPCAWGRGGEVAGESPGEGVEEGGLAPPACT